MKFNEHFAAYMNALNHNQVAHILEAECRFEYILFDVSITNVGETIHLLFVNDLMDTESEEFLDKYGVNSFYANVSDCIQYINENHLLQKFPLVVTRIDELGNQHEFEYERTDLLPMARLIQTVMTDYYHISYHLHDEYKRIEGQVKEAYHHYEWFPKDKNISYMVRKEAA